MKASKFSEAQIAFVLKQAEDGTAIGEVCRKVGISEATFYNWRKRYAGADAVRGEARPLSPLPRVGYGAVCPSPSSAVTMSCPPISTSTNV